MDAPAAGNVLCLSGRMTDELFETVFLELTLSDKKQLDEENIISHPKKYKVKISDFRDFCEYLDVINDNECVPTITDEVFNAVYKCYEYKDIKFILYIRYGHNATRVLYLDKVQTDSPFIEADKVKIEKIDHEISFLKSLDPSIVL